MKEPNWATCTEEKLWKYVAWHLSKAGIESTLVGGAVVAIYSKGAYRSGDLDFVCYESIRELSPILEQIGFIKSEKYFKHPKCKHLFVEFVSGPLGIGDDLKIKPDEVLVQKRKIKILSPTDCIRDRMASYIYFKARECLDQAALVAQAHPYNLKKVREWCRKEGAEEQFEDFVRLLREKK